MTAMRNSKATGVHLALATALLFLIVILDASAQQQQQQQPQEQQQVHFNCTPCDGEIDPSRSFDGLTCSNWLFFASQIPAETEECYLERLLGYQFCGCPSSTEETCTLCSSGDGFSVQLDKPLPFSSITCEAFFNVPKLDGEATCQVAADTGYYCGCPNAEPQCTLCKDGRSPQNIDAPLYLGMTCSDIQNLYSVSSAARCNGLDLDYPFDLQAYCGCPDAVANYDPNAVDCNFCPYEGVLRNTSQTLLSDPTSTCGNWDTLAKYAINENASCAVFQYVGLECCDDMILPDFFTSYADGMEQGYTNAEQVTESPVTESPVTESPVTESPVTESPVAESPVTETAATNLSQAIAICMEQYTQPNEGNATNESASSNTASNGTSASTAAEFGGIDIFQARGHMAQTTNTSSPQQREAFATTSTTFADITDNAETNTTSDANSWNELYDELHTRAIPQKIINSLPIQNYSGYKLLPGLARCLSDSVDSFANCPLCPNGTRPGTPDKLIPIVGLYCEEYANWRDESSSIQDCKALDDWLPFDIASFCNCPRVLDPSAPFASIDYGKPQEQCTFCPNGMVLVLKSWEKTVSNRTLLDGYAPTTTCAQWSQMAQYSSASDGCDFLQRRGRAGCCEAIGQNILDVTRQPVVTTTTPAPFPVVDSTTFPPPSEAVGDVNSSASTMPRTTSFFVGVAGLSMMFLLGH